VNWRHKKQDEVSEGPDEPATAAQDPAPEPVNEPGEAPKVQTGEPKLTELRDDVARLLESAEQIHEHTAEQAAEILRQAESDAEARRDRAIKESEVLRSEADAYAQQARAEADSYAEEQRSKADEQSAQLHSEADAYAQRARKDADAYTEEHRRTADEQAGRILATAEARVTEIVTDAEEKARRIENGARERENKLRQEAGVFEARMWTVVESIHRIALELQQALGGQPERTDEQPVEALDSERRERLVVEKGTPT
jgi:hypothetical protein